MQKWVTPMDHNVQCINGVLSNRVCDWFVYTPFVQWKMWVYESVPTALITIVELKENERRKYFNTVACLPEARSSTEIDYVGFSSIIFATSCLLIVVMFVYATILIQSERGKILIFAKY